MRVGTRLYLAVVPAVLGLLLVAALAYWGERGRQAPELVVVVALVAAVASLIGAWRNTRYVAQRVTQLAHSRASQGMRDSPPAPEPGVADELDAIEATVAGLTSKVAAERNAGDLRALAAETRVAEYTELVDDALKQLSGRLDNAHLPLHILLSSPFGSLNENQEEMLSAAREAIETADTDLRRLRKLIDIDRGDTPLVSERIAVRELLRPSLAIAGSRASARAVRLIAEVPDTLPRAVVDPVHTREAITALICDAVGEAEPGGEVRVSAAEGASRHVVVTIMPSTPVGREALELRLARRVLEHQGGGASDHGGARRVDLPAENM